MSSTATSTPCRAAAPYPSDAERRRDADGHQHGAAGAGPRPTQPPRRAAPPPEHPAEPPAEPPAGDQTAPARDHHRGRRRHGQREQRRQRPGRAVADVEAHDRRHYHGGGDHHDQPDDPAPGEAPGRPAGALEATARRRHREQATGLHQGRDDDHRHDDPDPAPRRLGQSPVPAQPAGRPGGRHRCPARGRAERHAHQCGGQRLQGSEGCDGVRPSAEVGEGAQLQRPAAGEQHQAGHEQEQGAGEGRADERRDLHVRGGRGDLRLADDAVEVGRHLGLRGARPGLGEVVGQLAVEELRRQGIHATHPRASARRVELLVEPGVLHVVRHVAHPQQQHVGRALVGDHELLRVVAAGEVRRQQRAVDAVGHHPRRQRCARGRGEHPCHHDGDGGRGSRVGVAAQSESHHVAGGGPQLLGHRFRQPDGPPALDRRRKRIRGRRLGRERLQRPVPRPQGGGHLAVAAQHDRLSGAFGPAAVHGRDRRTVTRQGVQSLVDASLRRVRDDAVPAHPQVDRGAAEGVLLRGGAHLLQGRVLGRGEELRRSDGGGGHERAGRDEQQSPAPGPEQVARGPDQHRLAPHPCSPPLSAAPDAGGRRSSSVDVGGHRGRPDPTMSSVTAAASGCRRWR